MRTTLVSILASYAAASDVPVLGGVSCNGQDAMTVTINSEVTLGKFSTICNGGDETIFVAAEAAGETSGYVYTGSFNPYDCAGVTPDPTDLSSYSVSGVQVHFAEKEMIGATPIFDRAHFFELSCTFQSSYDLVASLDGISVEFEDQGDGEFKPEISMHRVHDDFSMPAEGHVFESVVGDKVQFIIDAGDDLSAFLIVPTMCEVVDKNQAGVSARVFDYGVLVGDDQCGVNSVNFALTRGDNLRIEFDSFSLDPYGEHDYEIKCTASLCPAADAGSTCAALEAACVTAA